MHVLEKSLRFSNFRNCSSFLTSQFFEFLKFETFKIVKKVQGANIDENYKIIEDIEIVTHSISTQLLLQK